jgi:hypothetical protein
MDDVLVGAGSLWSARLIVLAAFMGEMDPLQAPCVCVCVCVWYTKAAAKPQR